MKKLYVLLFSLMVSGNISATPQGELLVDAAAEGNLAKVKDEIKKGANVNYYNPEVGFTALMAAAQGGFTDVVKFLISKKANVNMQGYHGMTALQAAVMQKHASVVKELLNDPSININLQDEDGHSAYDYYKAVNDPQINTAFADYVSEQLSKINFMPGSSSKLN